MRARWIWFITFPVFLLQFLLPGCGRKGLDPETLALMEDSDAVCRATPRLWSYSDQGDLILFLDLQEDGYRGSKWDLFVPHGGEGSLRPEGWDAEGIRYLEALRAYGKKHPREAEGWTFPYPEGIWTYYPPFSSA